MLIEHQHPLNKGIMVSVLGAPNVGKSSLVNKLIGTDLSIVSPKEQTTRNRFHCVFNIGRTEVILVDTPGLHRSAQEINKRMNEQAREGAEGADLNLLLIDLTAPVLKQITDFKENFQQALGPTLCVFTKSDLVGELASLPLTEIFEKAKEVIPGLEDYCVLSTRNGFGVDELLKKINARSKSAPHLYPGGDISNRPMRFFACEYIREQAFHLLQQELPYELAVIIDEYKDLQSLQGDPVSHIAATIVVNRPSQRAIVVGTKGMMIKEIGTRARVKIEKLVGNRVHLKLHVKVMPRWFKNNFVLEEIGLPRASDSRRVWHKKENVQSEREL